MQSNCSVLVLSLALAFFLLSSLMVSSIEINNDLLASSDGEGGGGDDGQQQDELSNDEPVEEPEPEPEPRSEDLPTSNEQQDAQVTQEPLDPQAEKEICVTNAKGQKFCYKELKPDEVCMKPINAEDPPICPPPKTEGIINGTSGDTDNPFDVETAMTADPTDDTVTESVGGGGDPLKGLNLTPKGDDKPLPPCTPGGPRPCLVKK